MWGTIIGTSILTIFGAYTKTKQDVARVEEKQDYTSVQYLDKVEGMLSELNRVYHAVLTNREDNARKIRDLNASIEQLKRQLREMQTDELESNQRTSDMLFEIEKRVSKRR